jgi:hypothetical protein
MFRWPSEITFDFDKLLVTVKKGTQCVKKCHNTKKKKKKYLPAKGINWLQAGRRT